MCFLLGKDLGQPNVAVLSVSATSISLSWSVPNASAVDSYEVMWQRDTSGECPDEDEGSTTITDRSTNYTIEGLEEDSTYMVTVTAVYSIGNVNSNLTIVTTLEAGTYCNCMGITEFRRMFLPFELINSWVHCRYSV